MSKRFTETDRWDAKWFRMLTPDSKLVLLFMEGKCDLAGFYELDIESMSFHLGIDSSTIEGAMKGLTRRITVKDDIVWLKSFLDDQKNLPLNSENKAHKHIINILRQRISDFPELSPLEGAEKGLLSPTGIGRGKSKGKGRDEDARTHKGLNGEYTEEFKQFWESYPRKQGKADAFQSWEARGCSALFDKILSSVELHKKSSQWVRDNGQFIPNPSTWLNQRRWEDEIEIKPSPQHESWIRKPPGWYESTDVSK